MTKITTKTAVLVALAITMVGGLAYVVASVPKSPAYNGWFELIDCNTFQGWGWNARQPNTPIKVDLYMDGNVKIMSGISADIYRKDLLSARIGDGRHGFLATTPSILKDGKTHTVTAKYAGTNILLRNYNVKTNYLTMAACTAPVVTTPVTMTTAEINCEETQPWATLPTKNTWSGVDWYKKEVAGERIGPGPNVFAANNAVFATDGLHMKISNSGTAWNTSEIVTTRCFKYGTFEFVIKPALADGTTIDKLDSNIVLGLFTYPQPRPSLAEPDLDGYHEIDVELAHFDMTNNPSSNLSYTVYPKDSTGRVKSNYLQFAVSDNVSPITFKYVWQPKKVTFSAIQNNKVINSWSCGDADTNICTVSDRPQPMRINLWLKGGIAPINSKPVDITVNSFKYTPSY